MIVNKQGQDWVLIRKKLGEAIRDAHAVMEGGVSMEEYHRCRGQIAMARELIEWVDPTTPPITHEDDYGISDPEQQE